DDHGSGAADHRSRRARPARRLLSRPRWRSERMSAAASSVPRRTLGDRLWSTAMVADRLLRRQRLWRHHIRNRLLLRDALAWHVASLRMDDALVQRGLGRVPTGRGAPRHEGVCLNLLAPPDGYRRPRPLRARPPRLPREEGGA